MLSAEVVLLGAIGFYVEELPGKLVPLDEFPFSFADSLVAFVLPEDRLRATERPPRRPVTR